MNVSPDEFLAMSPDLQEAYLEQLKAEGRNMERMYAITLRGFRVLARPGVSFTPEQYKVLRDIYASGDTLTTQKLILNQLKDELM